MPEYTTKQMFTDIGKETAMILASQALAVALLVGAGYVACKVQERRAKKAAK